MVKRKKNPKRRKKQTGGGVSKSTGNNKMPVVVIKNGKKVSNQIEAAKLISSGTLKCNIVEGPQSVAKNKQKKEGGCSIL